MSKDLQIGWCLCTDEARIAYPAPSRFFPNKDVSKESRGFLSCPAVRKQLEGVFSIGSPFSIRLRFTKIDGTINIQPVYPFTSLNEQKIQQMLVVEPPDTWRNSHTVVLQLPSPYLFFSDSPTAIEQFHPSVADTTSMNWRVVPGEFDIYSWQRPLNWSIEWDTNLGDLIIRVGEPLYFCRFKEPNSSNPSVDLIECEFTNQLQERLHLTRGITSVRKGIGPLMKRAGKLRSGQSLIKKKSS